MAVTFGFYNSFNHDRQYSAEQMGSIFDGIIKDGVYQSIGDAFVVESMGGMNISVGTGRAWFNRTWTHNDAAIPLVVAQSEALLDRIDTVVIEVDKRSAVRANSIKLIKGEPATKPANPPAFYSGIVDVFRYPLAYIYVKAGATGLSAANVTLAVGTTACPFVTGVLEVLKADAFLARWEATWSEWFAKEKADTSSEAEAWMLANQNQYAAWYQNIQSSLDGDVAAKLAAQIAEIKAGLGTMSSGSIMHQGIEDSNGESILDSNGMFIQGKLIYTML